jgi:hypothetical protein
VSGHHVSAKNHFKTSIAHHPFPLSVSDSNPS